MVMKLMFQLLPDIDRARLQITVLVEGITI
jgi:hypothetical protein